MRAAQTCFVAAILFALPAAAWADEGPPPEPAVKATAVAMPHPTIAEDTMAAIMRAIEAGMKKNPRLEMKDLDTRLADFAQEIPQTEIEAARQSFKSGEQALTEGNNTQAIDQLREAVNGFAKVLPYIKKQELADAMAALAVVEFEAGERAAGRREFVRLLTWRPDFTYDPSRFPPKYMSAFEDALREVERAKHGGLRIMSEPEGAQVYVDGRYYGVTPCTADRLTAGEHFITLKKDGYRKEVTSSEVGGKKDRTINIKLARSEKYLLVEEIINHAESSLGNEVSSPEMDNLRQVLFIEHAVFVRARAKGTTDIVVDAYLYDLRTHRLLTHLARELPRGLVESQLANLASALYAKVSYEGELAMPQEAPVPKQAIRLPLYESWWFWTAIGAVIGGVVGTATGIVLTQPATCPSGSFCPKPTY